MAATGASPYFTRIWLITMVDTLIRAEKIAVGRPMAQTLPEIRSLNVKSFGRMDSCLDFFRKYHTKYRLARIFPMVVAMAAPAAPICSPVMNSGSSTMFAMVPTILPIMASLLAPSDRTTKLAAADQMIKGAPQAIY